MKLIKATAVIGACTVALAAAISYADVHADVVVEESGSKSVFKVDGKKVTPIEAEAAAIGKHLIERCTPIKGAIGLDGKQLTDAYKCKAVVKAVNPKTGASHWKSL